jgi:hypothetical protein
VAGNVVAMNITGAPVLDPGQVGQAAPARNKHLGPVLSVDFRARGFAAHSDTGARAD